MTTILSTYPCARVGCEKQIDKGVYCRNHSQSVFTSTYTDAGAEIRAGFREQMRNGRVVCPLYAHEPVWFGHHTFETAVDGGFEQRCPCGFVQRIELAGVRYEHEKEEADAE